MKKLKDLFTRLFVNGIAIVFLFFFIAYAYVEPVSYIFTIIIILIQSIALWEYLQLLKKKELKPPTSLALIGACLFLASVFLMLKWGNEWTHIPLAILGMIFFSCFIYHFWQKQPIIQIATTLFGIIYITIPFALIIRIIFENKNIGIFWLIYLIAVTKMADTIAYFIGRSLGRKKLAIKLSPNKTVEGAIGGLFGSIFTSLSLYFIGLKIDVLHQFNFLLFLLLGLLVGIFGQIGDLAESLLKRDAEVKDSNRIPAVGGILDMVDSLLFTSPLIFFVLQMKIL